MGAAKYVVFKDHNDDSEVPGAEMHCVIFPNTVNHDDMAQAYMHRCASFVEPIGAGFFTVSTDAENNIVVDVHGESTTLKLRSREEDAKVLRKRLIAPG